MLGLLVVTGHVQVWQVFLLAIVLGIVNAFDMPIRQSFVVEMVGREDVANAVALNSAVFNGARIDRAGRRRPAHRRRRHRGLLLPQRRPATWRSSWPTC